MFGDNQSNGSDAISWEGESMSSEEYKTTETHTRRTCDEDGCEKGATHSCNKCGKDLCGWMASGHAIEDPYNTNDDNPDYICEKCLKIGEPFRKIIDKCREEEDEALESWEYECKFKKGSHFTGKVKA